MLASRAMSPVIAFVVLAALVAVSVAVGLVMRARQGRARRTVDPDRVDPRLVGVERWSDEATLVQFSTEFCARCPGVHRTLAAIADDHDGVEHVEVDLTHRSDLAKHFHVLQTPTTFVIDGAGVIRTRFGGPVARATVEQELQRILAEYRLSA